MSCWEWCCEPNTLSLIQSPKNVLSITCHHKMKSNSWPLYQGLKRITCFRVKTCGWFTHTRHGDIPFVFFFLPKKVPVLVCCRRRKRTRSVDDNQKNSFLISFPLQHTLSFEGWCYLEKMLSGIFLSDILSGKQVTPPLYLQPCLACQPSPCPFLSFLFFS